MSATLIHKKRSSIALHLIGALGTLCGGGMFVITLARKVLGFYGTDGIPNEGGIICFTLATAVISSIVLLQGRRAFEDWESRIFIFLGVILLVVGCLATFYDHTRIYGLFP